MKLKEFKEILNESAQFNIPNHSGSIPVQDFIIQKERVTRPIAMNRVLISMASLILVLAFSFYIYLRMTPVSTLTIDINPSIEVKLNVFNRVVSLTGLNDESNTFIEQLDPSNRSLSKLLEAIYDVGIENQYFDENSAYALIGIYGEEESEELSIQSLLDEFTSFTFLTITQHSADSQRYYEPEFKPSNEVSGDVEDYFDGTEGNIVLPSAELNSNIDIDPENLNEYAATLGITQTKLILVIDIFNQSDQFSTFEDFQNLVESSIYDLIQIFNDIQ